MGCPVADPLPIDSPGTLSVGIQKLSRGLEGDGLTLGRGRVVLANLVPIDHVPPRCDVLRATVLVLEIVGVPGW